MRLCWITPSSCTLLKASGSTNYFYFLYQNLGKMQCYVNEWHACQQLIQTWHTTFFQVILLTTYTCKSNCSRQLMSLKLCNSSLRNGGGRSKCLKTTKRLLPFPPPSILTTSIRTWSLATVSHYVVLQESLFVQFIN